MNRATIHTLNRCGAFKTKIVSLNKILIIPILILLISCNQKQKQIDTRNNHIEEFNEKTTSEFDEQDFEKITTEFAHKYTPNRTEHLDSIPNEIVKAFTKLRTIDKVAHERNLTLIFAKLYVEHLECCHQTYIIATFGNSRGNFDFERPSMVSEFAFMSGYLDKENLPEFWTSGIIEKWLNENPRLLKDDSIAKYYEKIKAVSKKIENGDYKEK